MKKSIEPFKILDYYLLKIRNLTLNEVRVNNIILLSLHLSAILVYK